MIYTTQKIYYNEFIHDREDDSMRRCPFCGKENDDDVRECVRCGQDLTLFDDDEDIEKKEVVETYVREGDAASDKGDEKVRCPRCGSSDVRFVTKEVGSDVDAGNACCGYILFGPLGLLCGFTGDRKSITVRKCMHCGHEF